MRRLTRWTLWGLLAIAVGACAHDKETELALEICSDGADNNENDLVDCADPLCDDSEDCKGQDLEPVVEACGDGVVSSPERCDTAIAADQAGACPTDCEPPDSCTKTTLLRSGTCGAQCTSSEITTCEADDGCCPQGCDAATDSDCSAVCGNGVVEGKERCDIEVTDKEPGACPTDCDDSNVCTADALVDGGSCDARCSNQIISACADKDGCCPTGCNAKTDDDCSASCGNGVVEPKERCDIEITAGEPGACPTDCDDGNTCTADSVLNKGTCGALCLRADITRCTNGDGCCPNGCNANSDDDCSPSCGNGVVEGKERCDTRIRVGDGACPTDCDDSEACTADALLNGGTCGAVCVQRDITRCANGDGCCPTGCNAISDDDCSPSCGNGVVEGKERCDTRIRAGAPGACPTGCDDRKACTADGLLNGGTCDAQCVYRDITQCASDDGCCPRGCNATNDGDCNPVCGNGVLERGERCDPKIAAGKRGACPVGCVDDKVCTADKLIDAGTCQARCDFPPITRCTSGDGCCPRGCNAANDKDCEPICGNGVFEPDERCDIEIPLGQKGSCPTVCRDTDVCTTQRLLGRGTCQARCDFPPITQCVHRDGCCPTGCNVRTDSDCQSLCGNGELDLGERCDPQIPAGQKGACPVACLSSNACLRGTLADRGTCQQRCVYDSITQCVSGDRCCPRGCLLRDRDCIRITPIDPLPIRPLPVPR